jgi:hypothetical protein
MPMGADLPDSITQELEAIVDRHIHKWPRPTRSEIALILKRLRAFNANPTDQTAAPLARSIVDHFMTNPQALQEMLDEVGALPPQP